MQVLPLYKYENTLGQTVISPREPMATSYTTLYRIVAEDGKMLTKDDINVTPVVDTYSIEKWREIDWKEEE